MADSWHSSRTCHLQPAPQLRAEAALCAACVSLLEVAEISSMKVVIFQSARIVCRALLGQQCIIRT